MTKMTMPRLGEDTVAAVVLRAMVAKGDRIEEGDPVVELETDKATTEVPSSVTGEVVEVLFEEGAEVREGDELLTVDDGSGEAAAAPEAEATEDDAEAAATEQADASESGEARESGEAPGSGEVPESGEARGSGEARASGEAREAREAGEVPESDEAPESEEAPESDEATAEPTRTEGSDRSEATSAGGREASREITGEPPKLGDDRLARQPRAAPSVRAFAMELGVDLEDVAGTGDYGRIVNDDVKSHVRGALRESGPASGPRSSTSERVRLSATRRRIADNVAKSWSRVVHVTQHDEADITGLGDAMDELSDELDAPVTLTSLIAAVVARVLPRFPALGSSLDLDAGEQILHHRVHLGVAVDTDRGLLVPVLHDADRKGVGALSTELAELAAAARDGSIEAEQLKGATFSITNLGGLGTTTFTPIVPWPQVGILSVGRASTKPVWQGDGFAPRTILPLGITYDHRALDGADAARFLRAVAATLQQPLRLLLG